MPRPKSGFTRERQKRCLLNISIVKSVDFAHLKNAVILSGIDMQQVVSAFDSRRDWDLLWPELERHLIAPLTRESLTLLENVPIHVNGRNVRMAYTTIQRDLICVARRLHITRDILKDRMQARGISDVDVISAFVNRSTRVNKWRQMKNRLFFCYVGALFLYIGYFRVVFTV